MEVLLRYWKVLVGFFKFPCIGLVKFGETRAETVGSHPSMPSCQAFSDP